MRTVLARAAMVALLGATVLPGCGGEAAGGDGPRIVVTTSILGDVVQQLVGDAAAVDVIMPPGTDPHDLAPSPRQAAAMREAEVLIVNGLGFEAALLDTIDAAEDDGVTVVTATDGIDPRPLPGHDAAGSEAAGSGTAGSDAAGSDPADGHDPAGDDDTTGSAGAQAGDSGGAVDPHFFTDPVAMRDAARHIADELAVHVDGLDTPAYRTRVDDYLGQLDALHAEVGEILAPLPAERRRLVTNHEVFGYFAARYDFEVLGAVLPGGSTLAEPSAADLRELAAAIRAAGVPAIFTETSSPTRLADALAAEGADVAVVALYSESLGEPDSDGPTYLDMVLTNARRIAEALQAP